jgi:hypothetical protein
VNREAKEPPDWIEDIRQSGVACARFADAGNRLAEPRLTYGRLGILIPAWLIAFSLKPITRVARMRLIRLDGSSDLEALNEGIATDERE